MAKKIIKRIQHTHTEMELVHAAYSAQKAGSVLTRMRHAQKALPIDRRRMNIENESGARRILDRLIEVIGPLTLTDAAFPPVAPTPAPKPSRLAELTASSDTLAELTRAEAHKLIDIMGPGYVRAFKLID